MSGMTRLFSGPGGVEIGFNDLDLGVYVQNPDKKSKHPRLQRGKIGFLGFYKGKNPVFSPLWYDPIIFRSRKCRNRIY